MLSKGPLASAVIRSARKAFAAGAVLRMQERHPQWTGRLGSFSELTSYNETLLDHLSAALEVERPRLFQSHFTWVLGSHAVNSEPAESLRAGLVCLRDEMAAELPAHAASTAVACIDSALLESDAAHTRRDSASESPYRELAERYLELALLGRIGEAIDLLIQARDRGLSATDLRLRVLAAAQTEIGERWYRRRASVADEHLCSRTTERALAILAFHAPRRAAIGARVLVSSVFGDAHDIGTSMVAEEFESAGWNVAFLGADTPPLDLVKMTEDFDAHAVALGATLAIHMRGTLDTIAALRASARTKRLPVIVGGMPFQLVPDLWQVVGADAGAILASDAVAEAGRLTGR